MIRNTNIKTILQFLAHFPEHAFKKSHYGKTNATEMVKADYNFYFIFTKKLQQQIL